MRQVTRTGLISVAAVSGALAMSGGTALADSNAAGSAENSPGVLSGNTAQAPVDVPVNACGNTVNVVGLLNPAMGNRCANLSHSGGPSGGGSGAEGSAQNSPGVASGNVVQAPIHVPVNACGNSANVGGAGNPAMGNECANHASGTERPEHPGHPEKPEKPEHPDNPEQPESPENPEQPEQPRTPEQPETPTTPEAPEGTESDADSDVESGHRANGGSEGSLAQTGAGATGAALAAAAGLMAGGAVLYRRSRAGQRA